MQLRLGALAWYAMLAACLTVSLMEIDKLMADWAKRPMDILEEIRSKQEIPFPSITICPEGKTLNPALEMYLNKLDLKYTQFPKTIESYLSIQIESIRYYFTERKLPSTCNEVNSPSFCQFCAIVNSLLNHALDNNLHYAKLNNLFRSLEDKPSIYTLQGQLGKNLKSLWSGNRILDNSSLVSLLTYFGIRRVTQVKMRENKVDAMQLFLAILKNEKVNIKKLNKVSSFPAHTLEEFRNKNRKMPKPAVLTSNYVQHAEDFWNLANLSFSASWKQDFSVDGKGQNLLNLRELYIIYMQLVYVQTADLSKNIGSRMVQLLTYENEFENDEEPFLHLEECDYLSEIDKFMKNVLKTSKKPGSSTFSLKDSVDLMTTQGTQRIHEIFSENKCHLSSIKEKYKSLYLKTGMDYKVFCKKKGNKDLCEGFNDTSAVAQGKELLELLHNTAHPPTYTSNMSLSPQPTSVVPLCFTGRQIPHILKKFEESGFREINSSFCTNIQQVYTDSGLCTVINFPGQENILQDGFLAIRQGEKREIPPLAFPQKTSIHGTVVKNLQKLEDGIILVLDSVSFGSIISQNRDIPIVYSTKKENKFVESREKNNLKIILHDKNDIPTLVQPQSVTFNIGKTNMWIPFIKTQIKVHVEDSDENIRSLDIATRECRFEDETQGLKVFKVYSEINCMYECKMKLAKEKCGCVPWHFPHSSSDQVCDPIGNLCFKDHMFRLLDNMQGIEANGKPPCDCYPSCRKHKYALVDQATDKAVSGWLYPSNMLTRFSSDKRIRGVTDLGLVGYTDFLTRYIFHSISPSWNPVFPEREALGHLQYLYPDTIYGTNGIIKTLLPDRINNIVVLHINFDGEQYRARTKIRRTSLGLMLSSFGGILGLFTGFSFMALFDICCWLKKSAKKLGWRNQPL